MPGTLSRNCWSPAICFMVSGIGDAVIAAGVDDHEEGGRARQRPIDVVHALPDRRALGKVADEVGVDFDRVPPPDRRGGQQRENRANRNAMPQDEVAAALDACLERGSRDRLLAALARRRFGSARSEQQRDADEAWRRSWP